MLELEAARDQILASLPPPVLEEVAPVSAHRRVLAETLHSPVDLPGFDNSAMDGYAVLAQDLKDARANQPVNLRLVGRAAAGEVFSGVIATGDCVRVFTGSPLPQGADAVIMQEDTRVEAASPGTVQFLDSVKPWENVRFRGEDLKRGAMLAAAGEILTAPQIGLLAAAGFARLRVGRRPVVGLLATGSELVEAGQPLGPGGIYESNRATLAALTERAGGVPRIFPLVPDNLAATVAALAKALQDCDIMVTSGGVSVGEADFVRDAFRQLGGQIDFWKVAIRPGRPFAFGRLGEKFFFGLPGNPVSAFVTFLLLVWPALARWQGARKINPPTRPVLLTGPLANLGDRRNFLRVTVDAEGQVREAANQGSHALASLAAANALVEVPAHTTLLPGTTVRAICWD
jgi:molybdopterin molybdotransferase